MDPFLKVSINQTLDRIQTESYESYTQRLAVLKAVAEWDEIKYRERDDTRGGAEARTRIRLIGEARQAAFEARQAEEDENYEGEEVDDSVSVHSPVFYG